jgi:sterol desaturase/sphingolipid hydroxylase (fatty acid hydroxylase superfamily)
LLHQYVLHSRWMWKSKLLSPTWKRIHYDHHQDPNDLSVLFGALHTTCRRSRWRRSRSAGRSAASAAPPRRSPPVSSPPATTSSLHCIQHLAFKPKWAWVQHMKHRNMEHHYFDESGNFGITNYVWDRIFGDLL